MRETGARESVRRTLARAGRRLRVRRLLEALPLALCAGLAGPALSLLLPGGWLRNGLAVITPLSAAITARDQLKHSVNEGAPATLAPCPPR